MWALTAAHTRTPATSYPHVTFNASFSQDRGKEKQGREKEGEEDEAEEPDRRGRRRWVGLMEEEGELKEEGGMVKEEVLGWGWGTEGKAAPCTFKPHPHPSKEGSTPDRAPRGTALGGAIPGHQLLGSLDKGFLSCPSVSPPGTEETGLEATF